KPTGYGSSIRRAPQTGIVDECCFRSCDLRRLEMYCAPLKATKAARSIRAQRHIDIPKTQKEVHLKNLKLLLLQSVMILSISISPALSLWYLLNLASSKAIAIYNHHTFIILKTYLQQLLLSRYQLRFMEFMDVLINRYQYVCVETPDAEMGHSKDPTARKEKIAGHNEAAEIPGAGREFTSTKTECVPKSSGCQLTDIYK
ncbi:hypothetical protein STEG23_018350, partial [Scotinomys teguina]